MLEGAIRPEEYEGTYGCWVPNHGLPRFREARFEAAYPLGRVVLRDKDVPLDVAIEAFNPLIPVDAEASGIPVAVLRFVLTNRTSSAVSASVCGSLENFIDADGSDVKPTWGSTPNYSHCYKKNRNQYRQNEAVRGVFGYSEELDNSSEQWGTLALSTTATGECDAPDGLGGSVVGGFAAGLLG